MACDRRNQELPPSQTEPLPVNSKTDLLLASAKPITGTGGISSIIYLIKNHTVEQGKSMGKKEWYGQIFMTWLQLPSSIHQTAWGGNVEELGVKLSLERRRYRGKGYFSFVFISLYPTLLLIDNKGH